MLSRFFSWFERRLDPYPPLNDTAASPANAAHLMRRSLQGIYGWLLVLALFNAGRGFLEAYIYRMMSQIIDWLNRESATTLWQQHATSLIIMALIIVGSILWILTLSAIRFQTLQGVLPMRLRWRFHNTMLKQSYRFFQDEFAGRLSAKVMQTALAVREVAMTLADMTVYILVFFFSTALVLLSFDARFLIPFAIWFILFALTLRYFVPKLSEASRRQADARSLMVGRVTDAYANIATVKLFAHPKQEADYARDAMQSFLITVHNQMRLVSLLNVINHAINMLLITATAGLGIYLWMANQTSVGAVAAATAMSMRFNGLSSWMLWQSASLFENIGTARDGLATLNQPIEVTDLANAPDLIVQQGDIRFENIHFAYPKNSELFHNLNLHIRPGEKIGIIGRSGAGKTSLLNLLLRFYDPISGRILIDGQDIAKVNQASLRHNIGMVSQDSALLHRSIRDNIMYGSPDASDQAIHAAAHEAQAADFIATLHDKYGQNAYDTLVGERGIKLSGGQRQRIAIARVILKNAPILLLDEATSALDSEVEAAIQDNLATLMHGKTVIAIAHRLSTIAAMDRLIVLDAGKIVEMGSHSELLAQKGLYAQLWARQSGGFLPED